jgi:hypothetical protein
MRPLCALLLCLLARPVVAQTRVAPDTGLAAQVAGLVDSVAWNDARYGWAECCHETHLVLRPRGTWTLVRTGQASAWFAAPADSGAFHRVATQLLRLGVLDWPASVGAQTSDVPTTTVVLRLPGQCHQRTLFAGPEAVVPPAWRTAHQVLDSVIAQTRWQSRPSPGPQWRTDAVAGRGLLYLCGP